MEISFIILISVLLLFSFLSSGFETAFVSLDIDRIFLASTKFARRVFLRKPKEILNTILLLNNIFNAAIAIFITGFFSEKLGFFKAVVSGTLLSFTLIIIFGEILPKVLASKYPYQFIKFSHLIIFFFYFFAYPVVNSITKLYDRITKGESTSKRDELLWLILTKERRGIIEPEIARTLKSSLYFSEKEVTEVLKPRTVLFAIDMDEDIEKIKEKIKNVRFNKIPLYKKDIDNIKGYLRKEEIEKVKDKKELESKIRNIIFLPENSKIEEAVRRMLKEKIDFAIVVDEYGGTVGFFTLEDVANELIGEMTYEEEIIEGTTRLDDLKEIFGINFPQGPYETIAGFLIDLKGDFPEEGEILEFGGFKFQVISRDKKRIKSIKIFR